MYLSAAGSGEDICQSMSLCCRPNWKSQCIRETAAHLVWLNARRCAWPLPGRSDSTDRQASNDPRALHESHPGHRGSRAEATSDGRFAAGMAPALNGKQDPAVQLARASSRKYSTEVGEGHPQAGVR